MLASAVFAFEITLQPIGLMPLLGGCSAAYMISALMMRHSIMTEKLARRGVRVPAEYTADHLDQLLVKDFASRNVASFSSRTTLAEARTWLATRSEGITHQGFPILDEEGRAIGMVMARELKNTELPISTPLSLLMSRPLAVAFEGTSMREAADHMIREGVGRLPMVDADQKLIGILTRSDLLEAHTTRLESTEGKEAMATRRWPA